MNILSPTQRIEYIGLNKNFTPVSRNTNGSISLNGWAGFEILEANKPYMVRSDGTPDYRLRIMTTPRSTATAPLRTSDQHLYDGVPSAGSRRSTRTRPSSAMIAS